MDDKKHEGGDDVGQGLDEQGAFPDARRTLEGVRSNVEEILGRIHWPMWWPWAPLEPSAEEPAADVFDTGDEFKVIIDLPGVVKGSIEISVTRDTVEISAKRIEKSAQRQMKYISRERDCASFKRVLALSEEIIPDETEATFEDGVLTISLKKKPSEPVRERVKVDIK